jgi:hypothetical protein
MSTHPSFMRYRASIPLRTLRSVSFARTLRDIAAACVELVGLSQWSLKDYASPVREDAKHALQYFLPGSGHYGRPLPIPRVTNNFRAARNPRCVLPPTHSSTHASTFIAQLLRAVLRVPSHRTAVAECTPPTECGRQASRG